MTTGLFHTRHQLGVEIILMIRQGRSEVIWHPEKETTLAPPCSKNFRKQMYCIEESTCDDVGTFRHSPVIGRPVHCAHPFPPHYAPTSLVNC